MIQKIAKIKGLKSVHAWSIGLSRSPGEPHPTAKPVAFCGAQPNGRDLVNGKEVTCRTCAKIAKAQ